MKGYNVNLTVSDPFEFPFCKDAAMAGERRGQDILLTFSRVVSHKDSDVLQVIASPRSVSGNLDSLEAGEKIIVNMTPIAGGELLAFETCIELAKRWRGWFMTGTVERAI